MTVAVVLCRCVKEADGGVDCVIAIVGMSYHGWHASAQTGFREIFLWNTHWTQIRNETETTETATHVSLFVTSNSQISVY